MSLAIGNCTYNVECVELQPVREITGFAFGRKEPLSLVEENFRGRIHHGLVLDHCTHRERAIHGPLQIRMFFLVVYREQGI